jgi:hypothetical protein
MAVAADTRQRHHDDRVCAVWQRQRRCVPGHHARVYFGDATASAPTNTELEADALARWLTQSGRARDDADEQRVRDTIVGYLATDEPSRSGDVDTDLDDADVFVEIKTVRLLRSIGLPVPEALAEVES